jgi:cardiolipin synthase A/B
MQQHPEWIAYLLFILDLTIRTGLSLRILMRSNTVGVTFAWMTIVLAVPYLGALLYLLIGERRLGEHRIGRARQVIEQSRQWRNTLCLQASREAINIPASYQLLDIHARKIIGYPSLPGNSLTLLHDYQSIFRALINDIKAAQTSCHLEFYIWEAGGLADELLETVLEAHGRGIHIRVLLDAVGSKNFLRGEPFKRLRDAGIKITDALRVSPLQMLFQRVDIRNHRKIAVIDNRIAYTGSQNLVDPRYFKQQAGVGEWVDLMIRVEGPAVAVLNNVIEVDWSVEARDVGDFTTSTISMQAAGEVPVQVVASGPVFREGAIHALMMSIIYGAQRELIITTPYFAPDEALLEALVTAANRGVDVTLVIPARVDSLLIRYATPALLHGLIAVGVRVAQFDQGLLHTKSITVDGEFCVVGSVNTDMRSLWLNFEISLFVYDEGFTRQVRELQASYISQSTFIDREHFGQRTFRQRLLANIMRLFAPVL